MQNKLGTFYTIRHFNLEHFHSQVMFFRYVNIFKNKN